MGISISEDRARLAIFDPPSLKIAGNPQQKAKQEGENLGISIPEGGALAVPGPKMARNPQ